jgi:hypothetical protein
MAPMTGRKPPGVGWETWVERQIREGIERGEFDDLPGKGKPIPDLDGSHDELWWVRKKLKREKVSYLPPTLAVRKERDDALERIAVATREAEVRRIVEEINVRIRYVNSHATAGPPSSVMPLDVDDVLTRWRATHP